MATENKNVVTVTPPEDTLASAAADAPQETSTSSAVVDDVQPDDWSNLADDVQETPPVAAQPEPEPSPEPEPEQAEEAPVPDKVDAAAEAAPEPEPEPEPEQPEPEPEPEPVAEEPELPEEVAPLSQSAVDQMWQQRETQLSSSYKLSEEEAESILTNAEETFPRLAARIQVETEKAVWTHLNSILPQMIGKVQQERVVAQKREDSFYDAFPKLKDRVSSDTGARNVVENMRQLFRQQNPKMAQKDLDAQIGAAAMVALKIPFTESSDTLPTTTATRQVPHRPASPRPSAPATPPKPKLGEIEAFAQELIEEDGTAVTF